MNQELKLLESTKNNQNPYLVLLNWLDGEIEKTILSSVRIMKNE